MNRFVAFELGGALVGLFALIVTPAQADTFGSGADQFTLDFVTIGDPGNSNDSGTTGFFSGPYGGVNYEFRMGTYEISESMIDKANSLGGLLITKDTRGVNRAATSITWNEAARFVNWLNTSQGYAPAYKFAVNPGDAGYTSNASANANLVLWAPGDAGYDPTNSYRNRNAVYFLPNENEWYKSAYYSGGGTTYYDYATGSDTVPTAVAAGTGAGTAVFGGGVVFAPADITEAGGLSHYGTMGQGGNVYEWNEGAFDGLNDAASEFRTTRGGGWASTESSLRSSSRDSGPPSNSLTSFGFRVASVPEPSSVMLLMCTGLILFSRRARAQPL